MPSYECITTTLLGHGKLNPATSCRLIEKRSESSAESLILEFRKKTVRGGARNFPMGADSSNKGAKILFLGYFHSQKSPKNSFSPSDRGG